MLWKKDSLAKTLEMMGVMTRIKRDFCKIVLKDTENLEKLRLENFDLAMTELFESCGLGIIKYLGIKRHITTFSAALNPYATSTLGCK
uniref:Glucuronosyltransferase n=1 Tax=Ditylenchus dipsaci TaxID=166011 RepID=A0A915D7S5_9BILA